MTVDKEIVFYVARRAISEGRMDALPVVINLDVFEDGGFELGVGCPLFSMHEFFRERREETLGDSIVPGKERLSELNERAIHADAWTIHGRLRWPTRRRLIAQ